MPVSVAELLEETSLHLTALTSHCTTSKREVSWVATTELTDPAPFLRGGELVCTTGLQKRTDEEWHQLVDRLVRVPVAALCIGTGLVRDAVPRSLVRSAEAAGLALINSPITVPFIQISRWVADRIFAEQYDLIRSSALAQDELLRDLLDRRSLPRLVRTLARHLGANAEVSIVDPDNRVIAAHPATAGPLTRTGDEVPILVGREALAYLRSCGSRPRPDILSSAANILGLEIARRHAVLSGRRVLAGQVLEDVVQHTGSDSEARRRLADLGLSTDEAHRVIIGRARHAAETIQWHPSAILRLFDSVAEAHLTASWAGDVVVVVSASSDAAEVAHRLLARLTDRDERASVGVGSAHVDVTGIRASYLEARHALGRGLGVHESGELSLSSVLLSNADAGLHDLAESVLRPLVEHDRDHGSALILTLRTWLAQDCSAAGTGAALHLHRNSLRYRLAQISQLTGRDLGNMQDRVELWLALHHDESEP